MDYPPGQLLTSLLRDVSRSFYLTLRVLPSRIRPQIGLAYLLARSTDTIADTELVAVEQRVESLQALRARILGKSNAALDFGALARQQGSPAEQVLLQRVEESLSLLKTLEPADLERVRQVLDIITGGQELDLRRFASASPEKIHPLQTEAELDDYTYRVAGCVGEFWTRMCRAHLFPGARLDDAALLANGIRFGKGLQLVNILRDIPADLRHGRCYLPLERLAPLGLCPADLLDASNESRLRPLYNECLDRAQAHLQAGWTYTTALPWSQARVRLACAWPILFGLRTLKRLRTRNMLDASQRIKITRDEVKGLMFRSVLLYPFPAAWRNLAAREL
jgi:farnesyl-diphosphate farnesyltransferase